MTLRTALQQWADLRSVGVKPSTRNYHREILELILRHWPGDPPIEEIDAAAVTQFALRVAHFSASRFNAIVTMLKGSVPAAGILKRRRIQLKDRPLLSQLEFSRLIEELDKRPRSRAGLVVRFLAHTGLRINEARLLRWADVHADCIIAPGSITKNGLPRMIPFVNGIEATLNDLRAVGDGVRVIPQAECKRSLQTACERAGVARLSHHDFRHLFATRCIQSGVDIPTVARWMGHRDGGALLAKNYYHLVDSHSLAMAKRVEI